MLLMKKGLLLIIVSICADLSFAQDTITKRNSEKVIAKILEISPTEVKYKKFDYQDGPTYIDKKSDIKMIIFANGMKEVFEEQKIVVEVKTSTPTDDYVVKEIPESTKIDVWGQNKFRYKNRFMGEREVQDVLMKSKDKKIMSLVGSAKDSKKLQYVGFAGIPLGIGAGALLVMSASTGYYGFDETYLAGSAICALAAIACPIVAVTMKTKRNRCNREAVRLYNEKY